MRRIALLLLAASSLSAARAATRPRYGGTLHVSLSAAPLSLDPASQSDCIAGRNLNRLIFDSLVILDERGDTRPGLATSWQAEPGNQRWHFYLRKDVTFQDGTAVNSDAVAASLRAASSDWKVFPSGDNVVIESDSADANLPAELALSRYSIAKRAGSKLLGSGPYTVSQWDPGKKLVLAARDDYWKGRPFVDMVEIELGRNLRDQMIALEVGKADVIEVAPEQAHRVTMESRRVDLSSPGEFMALVFARDPQSSDEARLRQALSASIDRGALSNVLFQGSAEPAGGLLPNWMTGYGFLFPTSTDATRVRQLREDARQLSSWTLSYDTTDPLARVVAERVALNARDMGLALQPTASAPADIRLVRVPLLSLDNRVALARLGATLGLGQARNSGGSIEDLYAAESTLLNTGRVVPLLHIRAAFGIGPMVRNWSATRLGIWQLPEVWLGAEKP